MQIVIDIPEEDYKGICQLKNEQLRMLPEEVAETLMQIKNGAPLPKGHGRLIDAVNHELTLEFIHSGFDLSLVRPQKRGDKE